MTPFCRRFFFLFCLFACFTCLLRVQIFAADEPTFAFRFEPVSVHLEGPPGAKIETEILCTISTWDNQENYGAAGWALSVASEGYVKITAVTIEDTDADQIFTKGFKHIELTYGAGNEGFVSGVILGYQEAVTLPVNGTASVARVQISLTCPEIGETDTGLILYRNGLVGSGEPIDNSVSFGTKSISPHFGRLNVSVEGVELPRFIRGDLNNDTFVNLADCIKLLEYLFSNEQISCLDAADVDDDGKLLLGDVINLLSYLFANDIPPESPFPGCGMDLTPDDNDHDLGCEDSTSCQ